MLQHVQGIINMKNITRTNIESMSICIFRSKSVCRVFEHQVAWEQGLRKSYGVTFRASSSWSLQYPHSYKLTTHVGPLEL